MSDKSYATMTFGEHLEDLRRRVILALVGILPIFVAAMVFGRVVLELLIEPARVALHEAGLPNQLQTTEPFETFGTYMRIAFIATLMFGSPWILWQLWRFVAPGLHAHEKRFAQFLLPFSVILSVLGIVFMYFVMLPVVLAFFVDFGASIGAEKVPTGPLPPGMVLSQTPALEFDPIGAAEGQFWINPDRNELRFMGPNGKVYALPGYQDAGIVPQYRVSAYIGTVLALALGFAVGFQMPVVVLLLGWVGIVELATLRKYRRHALFFTAVAAAVLTPADPLSMFLLWGPLYGLYEVGLLLLKVLPPERVARGWWRSARKEPADAGNE